MNAALVTSGLGKRYRQHLGAAGLRPGAARRVA